MGKCLPGETGNQAHEVQKKEQSTTTVRKVTIRQDSRLTEPTT